MATYRISDAGYYANKRRYRPGEEIVLTDGAIPAPHFIPVCDKAKALYAKAHATQAPQSKPVQQPAEQPKLSMSEIRDVAEKSGPVGFSKKS